MENISKLKPSRSQSMRSESRDMRNSQMLRKSEILTKVGSRMFANRSKAQIMRSESRDRRSSQMMRKSEILTKVGSRMFSNRSKVFHKNASAMKFRRMSKGLVPGIPTSGMALLEWTRNNMSFISTSDLSIGGSVEDTTTEEHELPPVTPAESKVMKTEKKKRKQKRVDERQYPKEKKSGKPKAFRQPQNEDEVIDNTNIIRGMEDEIMTRFRKRKEEYIMRDRAVSTRSEVTFLEANEPKSKKRKSTKPKKIKADVKKKKSALELKMIEERKATEELAAQAEREVILQKLLLKRAQDEEEEKMAKERNFLFMQNIHKIDEGYSRSIFEKQRREEWIHYSTCEKVPQVTEFNQLTLFIHKWKLEFENMCIEDVAHLTGINLELLNKLDDVKYQTSDNEHEKLEKFNWAISVLREEQWTILEEIVYKILLDIHKNMTIDDNWEYATFQHKSDNFTLSLWSKLKWPVPLPNPKKQMSPKLKVTLSEVDVDVTLPVCLSGLNMAIMCYHLPYDHMSDSCSTYFTPPKPEFVKQDLLETNKLDRLLKNKYEYESFLRTQYINKLVEFQSKHGNEKYSFTFVLPEVPLDESIPHVPVQNLSPTADEYLDVADEFYYERSFWNYITYVELDEVNLRNFHIVGGVFHINIVYQPPQRQELVLFHTSIRTVFQSRKLEYVPFHADFSSDPIPWSKNDESMQTGLSPRQSTKGKKSGRRGSKRGGKSRADISINPSELQKLKEIHDNCQAEIEKKKEDLILISIGLPNDVVYLEKPTACMWNDNLKLWETSNIHDSVHDDEKNRVTFLTTQLGIFGLAVRRYLNFPYRYWDIRPISENSIAVTLAGAKIAVHLTLLESNIEITDIEYTDCSGNALDWMLSKVMTLPRLVKTLRSSGLDLFPDYDANCYYKETSEKHWAMSYTTYYSMAMMAAIFNFSSSKWNSKTGRRSVVLKIREFDPTDNINLLQPNQLIHVTPLRCEPLLCTEEDDLFFDTSPEFTKFQPNLFYLLKSMVGTTNRARLKQFSAITIHTLAQFLVQTRLFSFS